MRKLSYLLAGIAILGLLGASPARAKKMWLYNAKHACASLVTQVHPELKGPSRRSEIAKCNADGDAYNKQAGF